ncbi:hypothetical protein [Streptomyces sp. NBC_00286]|uniref:hypothetical protein n=1 Tax=Streptomyces sp. NBC_00286 TaxID=2975701 RepID=UPI002E28694E|nr:hypothetical protein [Streptomyces sp. NBC_00286]
MVVGFVIVGTLLVAVGGWVGAQFQAAAGTALIAMGAAMVVGAIARHRGQRALEAQQRAHQPLLNPLGGPPPAPAYEDAGELSGSMLELYGGDRPDPGVLERSFSPSRPRDGSPEYLAYTDGFVVATDTGRLVIPWDAIRAVWHRREFTVPGRTLPGVGARTLPALCELALEGTEDRLALSGSPQQEELSAVIVDRTRERIVRRIREMFDREGTVRLGELTLTREGVYDREGGHLPWGGDWRIDGLPFPTGEGERPCYNTVYVHSADRRTLAAQVPELTVATGVLEELSVSLAS